MSSFAVAAGDDGVLDAGSRSGATRPQAPGPVRYVLELPDCTEAPSAARKALAGLSDSLDLLGPGQLRDARLLVSELVANAVRYGGRTGAPVFVSVGATPRIVRVEVSDAGAGFDLAELGPPMPTRAGGRGLPIVAALAARWGVECGETTTVWFEIERARRAARAVVESVAAR